MPKKVGILVGSLRKGSFTRQVAKAASKLFPKDVEVTFLEIGHLPLFNQDYDDENRAPESYTAFRKEVAGLDGVLIATPEYNRSTTAVLKNALDVASRPWGKNQWDGKPAAIVSVSIGAIGGFGANHHLRQSLAFLNLQPVQQPEAYIGNVESLLDAETGLKKDTLALLQAVVDALVKKL
ncbi:MAG: NAD(P)H-dependent oxidoreductase [Clostridiales bacterium]|nr:NAD(P)H-dependent oxidoreductase [Clostridiales bacterium]